MLGCRKGSKIGHFSSPGSSETCRNSVKNQIYVHCTLSYLDEWTKFCSCLICPRTPQVPWDKAFLSRTWVQPLDLQSCMPVPRGKTVLCSGIGGGKIHRVMSVLRANVTSTTPKACVPNGWTVQGRKTVRRQRGQRNRQQQTQHCIFGLFFLLLHNKLATNAFLAQGVLQIWTKI